MLLRSLARLFSSPTAPKPIDPDSASAVVLYAAVPRLGTQQPSTRSAVVRAGNLKSIAHRSHRQRLLNMRVEHIRICNGRRCRRLRELGIVTAGDLAAADPERLASHFSAPRKAMRVIQHYRRAIRFAASVPGMMPRDAMLLISIHRRSIRGLASESAALLQRDLQRFSESSQGQAQLRGRRLPSTRRIKKWINQCELLTSDLTMRTRAA